MFLTGCSIGEISLEKNSINWSNRSAVVSGKGDKEREDALTLGSFHNFHH